MQSIDAALLRYTHLLFALTRLQRSVDANPADKSFLDAGIVSRGLTPNQARLEAAQHFDEMRSRLDHLAVLDMCAAFEQEFSKRIGNAIGEARGAVKKSYKIIPFSEVKDRLIRERSSLDTLDSMFSMLEGKLSSDTFDRLTALRKQRNSVAHGGNLNASLALSPTEVYDLLNEISAALW